MEIEIVTTKKKLTKSLIQQMREIQLEELETANVLGFINDNPIIILLELDRFEYRKMYWHWDRSGNNDISRRVKGRYITRKHFKAMGDRDRYLSKLDEFKKESVQIYI